MSTIEKFAGRLRTATERLCLLDFQRGFKRSKKGNTWREYEGLNVSVFQRETGSYDWSIADEDGPRFSNDGFESESAALTDLALALEL